jgi:hypothetical protein
MLHHRSYEKQTLVLLRSPRRAIALSSAPRLTSAILRKHYIAYFATLGGLAKNCPSFVWPILRKSYAGFAASYYLLLSILPSPASGRRVGDEGVSEFNNGII